jgi:RNA polymerase sigma factor (sigma-70 family)
VNIKGAHDVELAGLSAAGDRAAYGELVRRHSSTLRGLIRRMGADPATADDVAQDTLLKAFLQITDYRGDGSFSAWLKRIAVRLYLRRRERAGRFEVLEEDDEIAAPQAFVSAAGQIDLDTALAELGEVERLCVSLCYAADYSHAEVAEALNLPLGTVKSHVRRGLNRLRLRLNPSEIQVRSDQHA